MSGNWNAGGRRVGDLLEQSGDVELLVLEQARRVVQRGELLHAFAEVVHRAARAVAFVGDLLPQPFERLHLGDVLDAPAPRCSRPTSSAGRSSATSDRRSCGRRRRSPGACASSRAAATGPSGSRPCTAAPRWGACSRESARRTGAAGFETPSRPVRSGPEPSAGGTKSSAAPKASESVTSSVAGSCSTIPTPSNGKSGREMLGRCLQQLRQRAVAPDLGGEPDQPLFCAVEARIGSGNRRRRSVFGHRSGRAIVSWRPS